MVGGGKRSTDVAGRSAVDQRRAAARVVARRAPVTALLSIGLAVCSVDFSASSA